MEFDLIRVTDSDYYVECPARFGVVRTGENEVCLIDSGENAETAEMLIRILDSRGWRIRAIFNTHAHADHVGGNRRLQERYGCPAYANGAEPAFARRPILNSAILYGGDAPEEIQGSFLTPDPSDVRALTPEVLPEGWTVLPLPGHTYDMIGYRTPGGTVFLGDSISSRRTLENHGITFMTDIESSLQTLKQIRNMTASTFVPAHAAPCADISELAEYNAQCVRKAADRLWELCKDPLTAEEVMKRLFDGLGLKMSLIEYALTGSTVRSFLSWLKKEGRVIAFAEENRLLWKAI